MNKDRIETIFRQSGLVPELRKKLRDVDVYVGDGFSAPPHKNFRRFGIGPDDYTMGMYVTFWWVSRKEEELDIGQPLFFEPFHDPDYSKEDRKQSRINRAVKTAEEFLKKRTKNAYAH
jgi:hypothetical protein